MSMKQHKILNSEERTNFVKFNEREKQDKSVEFIFKL